MIHGLRNFIIRQEKAEHDENGQTNPQQGIPQPAGREAGFAFPLAEIERAEGDHRQQDGLGHAAD